jgi:hypothetical protein
VKNKTIECFETEQGDRRERERKKDKFDGTLKFFDDQKKIVSGLELQSRTKEKRKIKKRSEEKK